MSQFHHLHRHERQGWLVALGTTLLGFFLLRWLVDQNGPTMSAEPWLTMWLELAVVVMVALLLLIWVAIPRDTLRFPLAVGVVSLFLSYIVSATLQSTPYTLDALSGDQGLYTAYVTKFAAYVGNVDAVYADLPAFYPPLYFLVLGRLADWFTLAPYSLLKLGLVATTVLLPFLLSWCWRNLVDLPLAAAAVLTLLVEQQWYKPAEWLTMVLFVPWWIYWVENVCDRRPNGWWGHIRWWLVGGLTGALLFQTYYYWFFIGGVAILMQLTAALVHPAQRRAAVQLLRNSVPMLVSSACLSVLYWGPYLYSMFRSGGWHVLQTRWMAQSQLTLPLPFAEETVTGVALLFGTLYLAVTAQQDRVSRALLILLLAVYAWLGIGYIGMLTDQPLLLFRAYPFATYLSALGLAFGLMRLWQETPPLLSKMLETARAHQVSTRIGGTLFLLLVFIFAQSTVLAWLKNEDVPKAMAMVYPTDQLSALDTAVQEEYGNRTVLLSRDYVDWIAYRPLFSFLAWSAHYSHPAAHFYARLDLLHKLSGIHAPDLFATVLFNNRYDRIDYLLLRPVEHGWSMNFLDDNFPNRNIQREINFAAANLREPYFAALPAGERVVLAPEYAANPLPALAELDVASAAPDQLALLYSAVAGFSHHLALPDRVAAAEQDALYARLATTELADLSRVRLLDLYQNAEATLRDKARTALLAGLAQPLDQRLTDQIGVEKLQLLGIDSGVTEDEQQSTLEIYLEVLGTPDWDYTIWVHAHSVGEHGTGEVRNLDFAPWRPTSTWQPGQVIHLTRPLPLEAGEYEIRLGFWRSAEDVRLVTASGEIGITLGTITVP